MHCSSMNEPVYESHAILIDEALYESYCYTDLSMMGELFLRVEKQDANNTPVVFLFSQFALVIPRENKHGPLRFRVLVKL